MKRLAALLDPDFETPCLRALGAPGGTRRYPVAGGTRPQAWHLLGLHQHLQAVRESRRAGTCPSFGTPYRDAGPLDEGLRHTEDANL